MRPNHDHAHDIRIHRLEAALANIGRLALEALAGSTDERSTLEVIAARAGATPGFDQEEERR